MEATYRARTKRIRKLDERPKEDPVEAWAFAHIPFIATVLLPLLSLFECFAMQRSTQPLPPRSSESRARQR